MSPSVVSAHVYSFEGLEVDLRAGELCKNGERVKLQEQPLQILAMLLERPGEVVTREEIQKKLWPTDTFVEFDHSINAAIQRLRIALGDSADNPRFVETMARRGYRFIAPVDVGAGLAPPRAQQAAPLRRYWLVAAAGGAGVAILAVFLALNVAGLRDRVLRAVGAVPEPPLQIQSIAVLPLENLSGDKDQEYFADGMTDALITDLGNISALRVISRQSVMVYKGSKKPLPEIARELNVDAVVEGTVQRSGNRVRITAQLLDARADRHLWAEAYERDLRDVLTLQGEVAQAIGREVQVKLTPEEQARLAAVRPVNPEAHDLYLKGFDWVNRSNGQAPILKKALECFQQAIQKDPNFARAYLGVAETYNILGNANQLPSDEAYPKAKAYARKALELDDTLDEAHVELANALAFGDWDWSSAEHEYKRAFEINPNSAAAQSGYSFYLTFIGQPAEAIAEAKRFEEISPGLAGSYMCLACVYLWARHYDEALAQFRKGMELNPNARPQFFLGWIYVEKGMYEEAIAEFQQLPDGVAKFGHLGNAYARAGNKAEARKAIQKLAGFTKRGLGTYEIALVYAGLGEKDQALMWLEQAYKAHDKGMPFLKVDPSLDPLRSDPRFQDLLRRMNFPP